MSAIMTGLGAVRRTPRRRPLRTVLTGLSCLFLYVLAANIATTQYVADHFGHHPLLGAPLFADVYSPFAWFHWQQQYLSSSRTFFLHVYVGYLLAMGLGLLAYVITMGLVTRSSRIHATSHGSAHFIDTEKEIRLTGLLPPKDRSGAGVYVGAWIDHKGRTHYLRHDGPEHIAVIAPTRSGKGVSLIVPTLLSWPESLVAIDMRGEQYTLSSGFRGTQLLNRVHRWQPAALEGSIAINPLAEVRLGSAHDTGDATNIAHVLIDSQGATVSANAAHFMGAARALVTGCLLHVLYKKQAAGELACLYDLWFALNDPSRKIDDLYKEMLNNQFAPAGVYGDTKVHPTIAAAGRAMLDRPEEERGSVLSTAKVFVDLYGDPIIRRNTSRSDLRIGDLMNEASPVSLYMVVGAEEKDRLRPLMRLLINQICRVLLRPELKFVDGQPRSPHRHRLLLMLDEFPSYGKIEVFQEALAYIAGHGIKAYLVMQDIAQLRAVYGPDETIISNLHIRVAFAPNKPETAEWLSKLTGTTTIVKEHISTSGRRFGAVLQNVSRDFQEQSRPLMTPDEIMRLKAPLKGEQGKIIEAGEILVFVAGHGPIRGTQSLYFIDPTFKERAAIPPPKPPTASAPLSTDNACGPQPTASRAPANSPVQPFSFRG
jgi:type IV secretion system protein VirD4